MHVSIGATFQTPENVPRCAFQRQALLCGAVQRSSRLFQEDCPLPDLAETIRTLVLTMLR
jgi:hypothetical protein